MTSEAAVDRPAVRVTVGQLDVGPDRAANLAAVEDVLRAAAESGAALAVVPEYASQYDPRGVGIEQAEPLDGPWVTALRAAAARYAVAVIAGVVVPAEGADPGAADSGPADSGTAGSGPADSGAADSGPADSVRAAGGSDRGGTPRAHNVVVAIDAAGELIGSYAKVHLYDAFGFRESDRLAAGDPAAPPLVVDVAGLRFGVLTCYDLRFPESARRLVDAGAEAIVVPAAWVSGPGKAEQWRALAVARAIENGAVVLAVGQAGAGRTGRSVVVDPEGVAVAELGEEPQTFTVELDPAAVDAVRARNPVLDLRRYTVVPRHP